MSVTFAPATGTIVGWKIDCGCVGAVPATFDDRSDAVAWLEEWDFAPFALEGCTNELCTVYSLYIEAVEEQERPQVNMANGNAAALLEALGLLSDAMSREERDDAFYGEMSGEDFLGRVMMAQAVAPADAGMPAYEMAGSGARFIECGRPEGYLQDRLSGLREVADFAVEHGVQVQWS